MLQVYYFIGYAITDNTIINCNIYIYIYIYMKIKNQFFSLCIPINFNQTAVGLFWIGTKLLKNTS